MRLIHGILDFFKELRGKMNIVSLDGTDFKLSAEQYNGLRNWLYIQSNYNELNRIGLNTRFSCCGLTE